MKKKHTQSEKLFGHEDLRKLLKIQNDLILMEKIEEKHGLGKIINNTYYADTIRFLSKYNRRKKAKSKQ